MDKKCAYFGLGYVLQELGTEAFASVASHGVLKTSKDQYVWWNVGKEYSTGDS